MLLYAAYLQLQKDSLLNSNFKYLTTYLIILPEYAIHIWVCPKPAVPTVFHLPVNGYPTLEVPQTDNIGSHSCPISFSHDSYSVHRCKLCSNISIILPLVSTSTSTAWSKPPWSLTLTFAKVMKLAFLFPPLGSLQHILYTIARLILIKYVTSCHSSAQALQLHSLQMHHTE